MKTRIGVLGLGGVGGFAGAKLAHFYTPDSDVEVSFLARGKTLENIMADGIRLVHMGDEITGRPFNVSDDPADIGPQDYLICAVKAYGLDGLIGQLAPMVGKETAIVPFLNGVEGTEKLRKAFPENTVADGCAFIVSEIISPGVIRSSMEKYSYKFGLPKQDCAKLGKLCRILNSADINAEYSGSIERIVWEKFAFISPISTLMSYVQKPYGEMIADEKNAADLKMLLCEFCEFAAAKGADLGGDAYEKTMLKFNGMPPSFTTSMQRDFAAGKANELETLAGYVLRNAQTLGLDLPCYEKYYKLLSRRS